MGFLDTFIDIAVATYYHLQQMAVVLQMIVTRTFA